MPEIARVVYRMPTNQPRNLGAAGVWIAVTVTLLKLLYRAKVEGPDLIGSRDVLEH